MGAFFVAGIDGSPAGRLFDVIARFAITYLNSKVETPYYSAGSIFELPKHRP